MLHRRHPLAELSTAPLAGLLALAAPPILCLGALNPLFDRTPVPFGNAFLPGGWLVFASLSLKGFLSATAAYILAATTGAGPLFGSLGRLGLPRILCVQFSLVHRYLSLLMEEAARILKAHSLRAGGRRGVEPRLWGPLPGQLLIRTWARAERAYGAMLLRGFDGKYRAGTQRRFGAADLAFVAAAAVGIAHLVDRPPFRLSGGEKRAAAFTIVSPLLPRSELDAARSIAASIGILHVPIEERGIAEDVAKNTPDRCYHC